MIGRGEIAMINNNTNRNNSLLNWKENRISFFKLFRIYYREDEIFNYEYHFQSYLGFLLTFILLFIIGMERYENTILLLAKSMICSLIIILLLYIVSILERWVETLIIEITSEKIILKSDIRGTHEIPIKMIKKYKIHEHNDLKKITLLVLEIYRKSYNKKKIIIRLPDSINKDYLHKLLTN
jgi:hypothetical protein